MATILSYITYIHDWFSINLEKYNFYLMPLSFFHPDKKYIPVPLGNRDKTINNVLQYIRNKEEFSRLIILKDIISRLLLKLKVVKASKVTDAQKIAIFSDPSAPKIH